MEESAFDRSFRRACSANNGRRQKNTALKNKKERNAPAVLGRESAKQTQTRRSSLQASAIASSSANVFIQPTSTQKATMPLLTKWKEYSDMSSTPSLSSPTRSPYLKEKIKADAIHGAGLAFSLSQLMSELDALTLTESELKEELTSEIEAKRAMEERLRRANTPSAYSSYKDDASLDLTDDDTDENVVGGRESVASRGMLQRAESRNSIQSRGSVLTGGGQLKRQNSVRRKALRSFLWGSSKSPEKTKEKKVRVAGKASKPVTTKPSVTKPSAPKPAVNAAPQVQEKAGLGSDSDSSSASILLSSDSDDSSDGVDSVRGDGGDGGDGGESDVETEVESKAIGGGLEEDSVVTRSQDPAVTSKAVVEQTGGREHEQTDDLDDMIINESAEIAKLEKETVRLTQLLEVTKRDLEECKIGWKRSWARCEREIGELVLESQKK